MSRRAVRSLKISIGASSQTVIAFEFRSSRVRGSTNAPPPVAITPTVPSMSRVTNRAELEQAWKQAKEYDGLVLAERWIEGEEYTVAILNGEALPAIRLETPREFYDYDAKYRADTTRYHCPCGLTGEQEAELQQLALNAFRIAGASGWGRVDLMRDREGQPWLIEVNTVPGMTDHSLVPMAAKAAGIGFDELVVQILSGSLKRESSHGQ